MEYIHTKKYIRKLCFHVTQDDLDFINSFAREHGVSRAQAVRGILRLIKANRDRIGLDENVFTLK